MVRLLETAAEIAGGERDLAARLGVAETLLSRFMAGYPLPDAVLLRAVDIVLEHRQSPMPRPPASSLSTPAG
jgi:hypothetical protein